jgi:metal-dependent amidase/aminoacylase/carboxypeptidase family protein
MAACTASVVLLASASFAAQPQDTVPEVASLEPGLEAMYRDLHQHPELGFQEVRTSALLAEKLRALGYEVTTGVGKTGIVALLRNGAGPTVMLRTELDALPVEEKTGLPFASTATATDASGASVHVDHACGHDLHMTAWYGTAQVMAQRRSRWHGTLMLVGQPAEELGDGAAAMLADGLFTRFPKPQFAIGSRRCRPVSWGSTPAISAPPSIRSKSSSTAAAAMARIRTWRSIRLSSRRARYWACRPSFRARPTRSRRPSSRWARSTAARPQTSSPLKSACC